MSKEIPARPDYYSWTKDAPVFPDWKKPKKDVKDQPQVKEDIWTYEGFKKLMEASQNAQVTDKTSFNDGWNAYEVGKPADGCPHRHPTKRAEWEKGYKAASRIHTGGKSYRENEDAPWKKAGVSNSEAHAQWRAQQRGMSKEDMESMDHATKKGDSAAEKLKKLRKPQ